MDGHSDYVEFICHGLYIYIYAVIFHHNFLQHANQYKATTCRYHNYNMTIYF
jgi:hypothetical protein